MSLPKLIEPTSIIKDCEIKAPAWVRFGATILNSTIQIGSFVGFNCTIEKCLIGHHCMIASGTRIGGIEKCTVVGDEVWVGSKATVLPGVTIGNNTIIAAGANVQSDVPSEMMAIGNPASIIPRREFINDRAPDISKILQSVLNRRKKSQLTIWDNWDFSQLMRKDDAIMLDADFHGEPTSFGANTIAIGRKSETTPNGGIEFASNVRIGDGCVLEGTGGIHIGSNSVLGAGTYVLSSTHDTSRRSLPWKSAPVRIGSDVNIGYNCVLVGPITVGNGAQIEPNSLVIRDIPANSTTRGVLSLELKSSVPDLS